MEQVSLVAIPTSGGSRAPAPREEISPQAYQCYAAAHHDLLNQLYLNKIDGYLQPSFLTLVHHMAIAARETVPPKGMALVVKQVNKLSNWPVLWWENLEVIRLVTRQVPIQVIIHRGGISHPYLKLTVALRLLEQFMPLRQADFFRLSDDGRHFALLFRETQRKRTAVRVREYAEAGGR
ncbi:uncharacterized protein EV422DRAFT_280683 [Fimicolochytrium jonesii]|uniref:uncharacterized protein n=1 Tax=Fimicolochytrium jonesii TaxID=1396493 RepID=UPI0022FE3C8D|nr:uncharacterized protein EV422DRAFT_280683 [Fimicolochytrium jonesii]KAI8816613.1 hypothetical protein EV422DRAFT_280683 [Fimicolochytrium jonesii]